MASAVLHVVLFGTMLIAAALNGATGGGWGGSRNGDSAISATLVSNAAIPLPATEAPKENILANESKGISKSQPKVVEPEPKAIAIPDRNVKPKPEKKLPTPTIEKPLPKPVETATNVVPFGQGGPVSGPYTMFKSTTGSGGMQFGSGGTFGTLYDYYVQAVRRRISDNWLKYEVDPSIQSANRVYLTFDILHNGQPTNVQISQSSGIPSLDQSAVRALQRIDSFGELPQGYRGSKVSVEFWFDYKK
ncbi:MAG: Cell division and transport-associated protein TolA [Acidobacteriales bacterium]|nr:Cell division and transport-associated protein TolA [Terriglobales bacterium]